MKNETESVNSLRCTVHTKREIEVWVGRGKLKPHDGKNVITGWVGTHSHLSRVGILSYLSVQI